MANKIASLHQLLDHDMARFYSGEIALGKVMNEWIEVARAPKLKQVLQRYAGFVQEHIIRLDEFITAEKIPVIDLSNKVMEALIGEVREQLSSCADAEVKDACLLSCIQRINHFKISGYGTAAAFANTLEMRKQATIFHQSEVNEKQIDDRLSQLAEFDINLKAKTAIV